MIAFAIGVLGLLVAYIGIQEPVAIESRKMCPNESGNLRAGIDRGNFATTGCSRFRRLCVDCPALGARTKTDTSRISKAAGNGQDAGGRFIMLSSPVLFAAGLLVGNMQKLQYIDLGYGQKICLCWPKIPKTGGSAIVMGEI